MDGPAAPGPPARLSWLPARGHLHRSACGRFDVYSPPDEAGGEWTAWDREARPIGLQVGLPSAAAARLWCEAMASLPLVAFGRDLVRGPAATPPARVEPGTRHAFSPVMVADLDCCAHCGRDCFDEAHAPAPAEPTEILGGPVLTDETF